MNFNNKKFNKWSDDANKELNWYSSDTEQRYRDNLKKNHQLLLNNNWTDNSFTYKFNSSGFRCEEFTDTDSILFLGCSFTQGIGLPVESIFPTIVAKNLNLKCYNLAVHGTSADTAFRLASIYLEKLKPKICVPVLIFEHRLELLQPDTAFYFTGQWSMVGSDKLDVNYRKYYIEFYEKWIIQPENAELNYLKNILAINQLCNQLNIKFYDCRDVYVNDELVSIKDYYQQEPTLARDLIHPGVGMHDKIAHTILSQL